MTTLLPLSCKAQSYAWGKVGPSSLVAQLLAASSGGSIAIDPAKPYAELWMGTHPSAPASVAATTSAPSDAQQSTAPLLRTLLTHATLGPDHAATFGAAHSDLPYLFKVLSIRLALSIQAHPDKQLAATLRARDPANYPDDNHKPELVVALSPFKALCCFRRVADIRWFAAHVEEFAAAVGGVPEAAAGGGDDEAPDQRAPLQPLLARLYATPAPETAALQRAMLARLDAAPPVAWPEFALQALAAFRLTAAQFPDDVGCWMVFVLNVIDMAPGDGLFLAANEPHAYLAGDCVEIMAASDNVIRAGLTPKFKDVATLVECLTYRTDSLRAAAFRNDPAALVQSYVPPPAIPEFRLDRVRVPAGAAPVSLPLHSAAIFLVVAGAGTATRGGATASGGTADESQPVRRGDVRAVLYDGRDVAFANASASEDLVVFVAQARGDGRSLVSRL
jgi:mannose-6-phosphate isomerase